MGIFVPMTSLYKISTERAGENGKKFQTFCGDQIAELLPKEATKDGKFTSIEVSNVFTIKYLKK